ncbi:hypothetical protein J2S53_003133 [Actinopolyspora lacussalsi]|nr:hypothetical protein [Actinopolyspora lacussalsi]
MRKDEPVGTYYIVQPDPGDGAEVVEPMPGVRQLVAGGPSGTLSVQVPGRMGGPGDAARFARSLAGAALDFAQWCEQQTGGAHRLREDSRAHGYGSPEEQA